MHAHVPETEQEVLKLPRGWLINVGATVIGQPFLDWVKHKILERNAQQAQKQDMLIKMDPALAAAFSNSTHFSSKYRMFLTVADAKGTGAHLLKAGSKRRRT